MSKTSLFSFLLTLSPVLFAEEHSPEIIEILAPKQVMSLSTGESHSAYFDDRLEHNLNRTIADRLATMTGVSLNGQGGQFQSYAIRGFSRNRIRTEIDGIPIITDRRAGNSISFLASELFSDVSVVKGPSSTIYGSQALGGVVSLSSQMSDQSSMKLETQSGNDARALTFKHKQANTALGIAYQKANNNQASNGVELNTQFARTSGFVRHQYQVNGLTTVFSWLPSVGKNIGKSNAKYLTKEVSQYPDEVHSLAQIQINSAKNWLVKLFHHYQNWDSETSRLNQYDAVTQYQSHTVGAQWLNHLEFNDLDSYLGVDWLARKGVNIQSQYSVLSHQALQSNGILDNQLVGEEDNLAIYSKNNWFLGDSRLGFSFRYDWLNQQSKGYADATEQQFNAAVSANIPLSNRLNVAFELANGFRYPTLSERFFNGSTPRGLILGDQYLSPETSLGTQTSFHWQASKNLDIRSAVYYYDLDNYIERYRINDELLSYRNLPEAKIYGLEVEAYWYMNDNIEHQFSFQQQNGQDQQQQRLDDLLPKKVNWSMLLSFNEWSMTHSLTHYFNANNVGASEAQRASYTLWDLSFNYQLSSALSVNLVLNNIANQSYYASLDEDAPLQPQRSMKLAATWHF